MDGNRILKFPMQTLESIPKPNADAKQVVALVKKGGHITGYQLSDGKVLSKEEGVQLAREGGIIGVGIATRKGNYYLRSLPDGNDSNNLGQLPTVKQ